MAEAPKKKVVRVESQAPKTDAGGKKQPAWTPSPEAKKKATTLRIIAWAAWILAIGLELFAIFYLLQQDPVSIIWLVVALVAMAVLAVSGNLLWKQANRLDPASKKNKTKFFIQNQLGAIMTVAAFLPLVVLIFTNKNMDSKEKGIIGSLAALAMVAIAAFTGVSWDGGPSQEQYAEEENIMVLLTGQDLVYWTKSGKVFHVCEQVPDVNKESKDGQIYEGTIADAHAAGKDRITSRWESEATKYCGYTQEEVDAVKARVDGEKPVEPAEEADTDADDTEDQDDQVDEEVEE